MTQAFNLSQLANFVNVSGQLDLTAGVVNTLPVSKGGSGAASFTANSLLVGSGTSAFGTIAPGTAGNILQSTGTAWASAAAPINGQNIVVFNASGTWTVPAGVTKALVTVYGAGGGCAGSAPYGLRSQGGIGGYALVFLTSLPSTVAITIGAHGGYGFDGTSTSFGTAITATSGGSGNGNTLGASGSASVALTGSYSGTAIVLATENAGGILAGAGYGAGCTTYGSSTTFAGTGGAVAIQY